jgi:hypothetical protein
MLHGNLSSSLTEFYKYVFLPLWSGGFGYGTLQLFTNPESVTFNGVRGGAPPGTQWLFLVFWALGTGFISLLAVRLRSVRVYDEVLYASSFGHEVEINRRQLLKAEQVQWLRPAVIRILYLTPEGIEKTLWFMPEFAWPSGRIDDNLVPRLNAFAGSTQTPAA